MNTSRSQLNSSHNLRSRSAHQSKVNSNDDRSNILTRWINKLEIYNKLTTKEVIERSRTGVLLFKLVQHFEPISIPDCTESPKTRQDCLNNIAAVFDKLISKGSKLAAISSMDIYNGLAYKIWQFIEAIFRAYALPQVCEEFDKILNWMYGILSRYNQVLQPSTYKAPYTTLKEDMISGVNLLCILHHHFKNTQYSPVLRKVIWEPKNSQEMYSNVSYLCTKLQETGISICAEANEFFEADKEFIMLQIYWIYKELKNKTSNSSSFLIMKEVPNDKSSSPIPSPHSEKSSTISTSARSEGLELNSTRGLSESCKSATGPIILHGLSFGKLAPLVTEQSCSSSPERMSLDPEQIISPTNISPNSLNRNLQIMERRVMEQERFCMYISDLRRKKETSVVLSNSPSLRSLRSVSKSHSSFHIHNPKYSTSNLSHIDNLICYLITPRILKLAVDQDSVYLPYMFILTPHSYRFRLKSEAYIFEWRDLSSMQVVGKIDTAKMLSVKKSGSREITITSPERGSQSIVIVEYKLQCMDLAEAQTYYDGLTYLLHKKALARKNS